MKLSDTIKLYEPTDSDGYKSTGDGVYFLEESLADAYAKQRHGAYASISNIHNAIKLDDGRYLLLKNTSPVSVKGTDQAKEDLAKEALGKLNQEQIEALKFYYKVK